MKPFLRWAGSKVQLIPTIKTYWQPQFKRYVEPFCGSAALFFSVQPQWAVLSDLNSELICTLAQIQIAPDIVSEVLSRMPTDERSYYRVRAQDPAHLSPNERAAQFIYLNALCFNGLYRTNGEGRFNVPYGSKKKSKLFDALELREASRLLNNALLEASDFQSIVDRTTLGDFIYLDPPYATGSKRIFNAYGKDLFTTKDLIRLTAALDRADNRGVRFVLSYADVPEIHDFKKKWTTCTVQARRNISGFTGSRRKVNEIIVTNCKGIDMSEST
ncbi:MAG: Dam family site-specific DNA-(adenine-N6)-methyltransferase [Deltaproteobacteria bacterium]|nr:Dam family site-specific DNA-(adenine-N6)-methyltransferase [Deltaproteobacteria bacterium]